MSGFELTKKERNKPCKTKHLAPYMYCRAVFRGELSSLFTSEFCIAIELNYEFRLFIVIEPQPQLVLTEIVLKSWPL